MADKVGELYPVLSCHYLIILTLPPPGLHPLYLFSLPILPRPTLSYVYSTLQDRKEKKKRPYLS